jgi:hypothetical protein
MTIDQIIYEYIQAQGFNIYYGSAENQVYPYYVLYKIDDEERPVTLCEAQGEAGKAIFIFEGYVGGTANAGSGPKAVQYAQLLHDVVKNIRGIIGIPPDDYRIWSNETRGVTLMNKDNTQTLMIFGAEFETIIDWQKL